MKQCILIRLLDTTQEHPSREVTKRTVLLQVIAFLVMSVCVVSAQLGGYGILHYDITNIPFRLVRRQAEEE
jgi:hypothetical protein